MGHRPRAGSPAARPPVRPRPGPPPATAGDWTTYLYSSKRSGFNDAEMLITPGTAPSLHLAWSVGARAAANTQPIVVNGMAFWGSDDGYERADDIATHTQKWKANLGVTTACAPSYGVQTTPTYATVNR